MKWWLTGYGSTFWLMDPDESGGAAGGTTDTTPTEPTETTPAPTAPNGGQEGTTPSGTGQAVTPPAPEWQSAREYAASLGYQGHDQFQDDGAFIQNLMTQASRARELEQLAGYGQQYLQNHEQFSAWQAEQQRQQQAQATAQQKAKWWNPPQFDQSWGSAIVRDQAGNPISVTPGSDPAILPKYLAYQQYRRQFAERFMSDPEGTMGPMVEERAAQIVQREIQQHLGGYQERMQADRILQENASWLYHKNDQGGTVTNPQTGQPLLSPAGQRYAQYVQGLNKQGIKNSAQQHELAVAMVQRDVLMEQLQGQNRGTQNQQSKQNVLNAGNRRTPNAGGSAIGVQQGNGGTQNPSLSLRDQLRQALAESGVTDEMLAAEAA